MSTMPENLAGARTAISVRRRARQVRHWGERLRHEGCRAEDAVDLDLDDHTLRIHPGLPVARGVAGDGFGHRVGGGDDMSLTFEREPAPSLELAHRDPATRTDVVGLA